MKHIASFPLSHVTMFFGMAIISFFIMPFIMIENISDWRPSLNQGYAAIFMGASMVILEAIYMSPMPIWGWVTTLAIMLATVYAIRTQLFVGDREYLHDMIPHHSMAILTSKAQLDRTSADPTISKLAGDILATQKKEIAYMKELLQGRGQWLTQSLY